MVVYDLICPLRHRFEAWFRSVGDYDSQKANHLLTCPVCESPDVNKLPSASYISTGVAKKIDRQQEQSATVNSQHRAILEKIRQHLDQNSEHVGARFAEEARKMHYGEIDKRNIHGHATLQEVVELGEEGVDAVVLPMMVADKKKLN